MRSGRFFSRLRIGLFLSVIIFLPAWGDSWQEIRANAAKIKTIQADFVQTKKMQMLVKPLVSRGTFYFEAPESLRWEYHKPISSTLLVQGGHSQRYLRIGDQVREDNTAGVQAIQMMLKEITGWLGGHFENNPYFNSRLESERRIVLLPKEKSLSAIIERIELLLGDRAGEIRTVTIFEPGNALTMIVFENLLLNHKIDPAVFKEPH